MIEHIAESLLKEGIEVDISLEAETKIRAIQAKLQRLLDGYLEQVIEQEIYRTEAESLPKIAQESNLFVKKVACRTLFGSNLVLANREARLAAPSGKDSSGQNQKFLLVDLRGIEPLQPDCQPGALPLCYRPGVPGKN